MARQVSERRQVRGAEVPAEPGRGLAPRDVAKFTTLVALSAIFVDAAVGHGLAWENDPYWTYWVTKTFLIATIFGLGTAWVGIGEGRGAAITAVHTVSLTVYYWSLSPIGMPATVEWLDLDHTWLTGLPIHFAVIYLGYLLALWVWRRRAFADTESNDDQTTRANATLALGIAVAITVVAGALSSLAVSDLPGVTWFVTRLLITFAFIYSWWAIVGRSRLAGVVGGLVLAFVWATYAQFLAPSGLPDTPLRIFESAPPPATPSWMGFREVWLVSLPIHIVVMAATFVLSGGGAEREGDRRRLFAAIATAVVVAAVLGGFSFSSALDAPGRIGTVNASGPVTIEQGTTGAGTQASGTATIDLRATDVGARVTSLPPHDAVDLRATIRAGGHTYQVAADKPMVEDPLGRHTTWWGVGFDVWHHGRSGIGTSALPAIRSKLALFALGTLTVDGKPAGTSVPIHFMTVDGQLDGVGAALQVGDEDTRVSGVPGGMIHAAWPSYTGDLESQKGAHSYAIGSIVMAVLLAALLASGRHRREPQETVGAARARNRTSKQSRSRTR